MFHGSQFSPQQGGASASLWVTDAIGKGPFTTADARDWRTRLRDWADEVELVPDLGQRVGSRTWFRGLATCFGLCASALYLSPGFQPLPGEPEPLLAQPQFEEVRSQMITPLAMGADSGRRMGPTDAVQPLRETPERPQIELRAQIGGSDSLGRALARAGVSNADAAQVMALASGDIAKGLKPGTPLGIVLGRRPAATCPGRSTISPSAPGSTSRWRSIAWAGSCK